MAKRLTEYAECAGCASKLAAGELAQILRDLPASTDPRVVVDYRTSDDAGVFTWPGGPALVQTVDFFTPIVDDPHVFGQIAAANALSDVYAMGGVPKTALAVAAFPKTEPGADVIRAIFQGGYEKLCEAGVALLGGHTVSDQEVKFGYAVTGEVNPIGLLTNSGARPGDQLLLTKPLGTGILAKAGRSGQVAPADMAQAIKVMLELNRTASAVAMGFPKGVVGACTDVTGFGLAGHASEIAQASGVTLFIDAAAVPVLDGALALAAQFLPCGGRSNQRYFSQWLVVAADVAPERHLLCLDPQTSGGLLLSITPGDTGEVISRMAASGVNAATIGHVGARSATGALVQIV